MFTRRAFLTALPAALMSGLGQTPFDRPQTGEAMKLEDLPQWAVGINALVWVNGYAWKEQRKFNAWVRSLLRTPGPYPEHLRET